MRLPSGSSLLLPLEQHEAVLPSDDGEAGLRHLSCFLPRLDPDVSPEAPVDHPLHPAAQQEQQLTCLCTACIASVRGAVLMPGKRRAGRWAAGARKDCAHPRGQTSTTFCPFGRVFTAKGLGCPSASMASASSRIRVTTGTHPTLHSQTELQSQHGRGATDTVASAARAEHAA